MKKFRRKKPLGSISFILIGLVSVMIIFVFALSRRFSGHNQLFTLLDRTQVARNFLESYVGDVFWQLRKDVNNPTSKVFSAFHDPGVANRPIVLNYTPSALLEGLRKDLEIEYDGKPEILLASITPMLYPKILKIPGNLKNIEKSGDLSIRCLIKLKKKKYSLSVKHLFKVVMRLTPMLREFILFSDKFHLEQSEPFGDRDSVNIVELRNDDPYCGAFPCFPWVLQSFQNDWLNVNRNGRVFLGGDNQKIFLNLSGEKDVNRGLYSEMWQISPNFFSVARNENPPLEFDKVPIFPKGGGSDKVELRGLKIPLRKYRGHSAIMGILGFSKEVYDTTDGYFANSTRNIETFLGPDPSFKDILTKNRNTIVGTKDPLGFSSALRLRGLNLLAADPTNPPGAKDTYPGPNREIFGNVFGRFFLITFFQFGSMSGGGQELIYGTSPPPYYDYSKTISVSFADSSQRPYEEYMSRVVSGASDYKGTIPPANFFKMNQEQAKLEGGRALTYGDFKPQDNLRLNEPFDKFGEEWFKVVKGASVASPTVQARICRYFPKDPKAKLFKEYVGFPSRFWVDGVLFIDGDLDLSEGIKTNDIRGGIVLVKGSITLGDITRGLTNFSIQDFDVQRKAIEAIPQDSFITFVSLTGQRISLVGDTHIGVQLISLKTGLVSPADQINWVNGKDVFLAGGIAVSTLNIKDRVRNFKKIPFFYYVPCMSEAKPSFAVFIEPPLKGYAFYVE